MLLPTIHGGHSGCHHLIIFGELSYQALADENAKLRHQVRQKEVFASPRPKYITETQIGELRNCLGRYRPIN
jgi:hypothetical protein